MQIRSHTSNLHKNKVVIEMGASQKVTQKKASPHKLHLLTCQHI